MDNRPIGIFDSGLGGLTAVREIMRTLPGTDIIYFGDTGRVPYGTRSRETIIRYTRQNIRFLKQFHIKALLIACGTASSAALPEVCNDEAFPIIGVVESAARKAVELTQNRRIGIIGTAATIKSRSYEKLIHSLDAQITTSVNHCPLFVPLVENGRVSPEDKILQLAVEEYLTPIRESGVDTLILGCTHYPIIAQAISHFMGPDVKLVNPGQEAARFLATLPETVQDSSRTARARFFVSDDAQAFSHQASLFLGREIGEQVELINIEEF